MAELEVYTIITSRYRVFDKSGKLPYSIAFGLCRRAPDDNDPRSLRLSAKDSILDVPYGLCHGLLSLREDDIEVSTGQLSSTTDNEPYVTLPSPVGRTGNWRKHLLIYHYHIHPDSYLGRLFKTGKKYSIHSKAKCDFGGDHVYVAGGGESSQPSQNKNVGISKAHGQATFTAVQCLPWPSEIQTKMQMHKTDEPKDKYTVLEVTVTNNGNEPISVQTRHRQRFLVPNSPMQQEDKEFPSLDSRPRIIDPSTPAPGSTIQVFDLATGQVVYETYKPGPCGGAGHAHDPRPKLEILTTLHPGQPLVRHVDISNLLSKLPDGKYGLRMEARGMWWCKGDTEDFAAAGEDRVPHDVFETTIPPLMLQCRDVVVIQVENGTAKW